MKTVNISQIAVEFPNQTTRVVVHIVEKSGIISRTVDNLTLEIPGIYQNLNSELWNIVHTELQNAGYDVQSGVPADTTGTNTESTGTVG